MKVDKETFLFIGLSVIVFAFASSAYCYEPPAISNKGVFFSLPAISRVPMACYSITSQHDDPPRENYPTTTTRTSSYIGTASLPSTSTTITL